MFSTGGPALTRVNKTLTARPAFTQAFVAKKGYIFERLARIGRSLTVIKSLTMLPLPMTHRSTSAAARPAGFAAIDGIQKAQKI
jgi:hypothetical protein